MAPLFFDRDVLFYRAWDAPPTAPLARPVILELEDGRSFVKTVLPGTKKNRYHLTSINPSAGPILDVVIVQMAYIWWVHFDGLDSDDGRPSIEMETD